MERTLVIFKPCAIQRELLGEVLSRFERKAIRIVGLKMMQLDDAILSEHYAHLKERPFFSRLKLAMSSSPVVVMCLECLDCVQVVRNMTGSTNGQKAAAGTIRGDYSVSGQENIIHASDSVENAQIEINRFFKPEELFDYQPCAWEYIYASDEI